MVITLLPKQSEVCGLLHADQCKQAFCYKAHWSGTLYLSVGSKITGWVKKKQKNKHCLHKQIPPQRTSEYKPSLPHHRKPPLKEKAAIFQECHKGFYLSKNSQALKEPKYCSFSFQVQPKSYCYHKDF